MINSNDFLKVIQNRQSDRSYVTKPVEKDKIQRIIEAGRLAPSACNAHAWKFIIVNDQDLKYKIADCTSTKILGINHFTKQAPIHIVIVEEKANFTSSAGSLI